VWLCFENPDLLTNLMNNDPDWVNEPYLVLVRDPRAIGHRPMFARPATPGQFSFGGNWLWSDDPEFPAEHPIPIHDAPVSHGPNETSPGE
jgi:hypothetical protein